MRIHGIDGKGSTLLSGSLSISGSVTAQGFNIDDTAVGTPALYSSTNLNLSASNAVVVTSSPLRLVSLTNAQTGSFTGQDGDIIFNSTRASYMAYSGSDWQDVIIEGATASYATQALSASYAPSAPQSTTVSYVTTTSTASAYNLVIISASADIALPSSPSEGDWVEFSNRSAASASLNPNGNKIMGDTGSFIIDNANAGFKITYTDANHGWVLVGVQGTTI